MDIAHLIILRSMVIVLIVPESDTDNARVVSSRADYLTIVVHKEQDSPEEEYYLKEYYSIPTNCKTPKKKPYTNLLWIYNEFDESTAVNIWPHHICSSNGRALFYSNPTEKACMNKNLHS